MSQPRPSYLNAAEAALVLPLRMASGQLVDLYDLPPEALDVRYIAQTLAQVNRFGGHTFRPYSVCEHSVLVSCLAPAEHALDALMHDASEAFCGDVISPIKRRLSGYAEVEIAVEAQIADHHGLLQGFSHDPDVRAADFLALSIEQQYFQAREPEQPIAVLDYALGLEIFDALPIDSDDRPWYVAQLFCALYEGLTAKSPRLQ